MKKVLLITVTLIVLTGFPALPAASAPKWPIPDGIKTIEVNGYDMAYQETGGGIPLVLIHGAMADYRAWPTLTPVFSKAYRTIAVSLRHCYPEKWNGVGDDYSVIQHASDIAALIKSLSLGKVHLLGHSRGGAVALNVAMRYPEVIRTLILEDAGGVESLLPDTPERERREAGARDSVRTIFATGDFEKAARLFMNGVNGPGTWENLPDERKQITLDNIGTAPGNIGGNPKISCADIQKFNFPILLVTGERSPKIYGEMTGAMRQCKPDIPAPLIVPNGTHLMHRDNPEFFNKAVLDFLNQY
jgi:esterase